MADISMLTLISSYMLLFIYTLLVAFNCAKKASTKDNSGSAQKDLVAPSKPPAVSTLSTCTGKTLSVGQQNINTKSREIANSAAKSKKKQKKAGEGETGLALGTAKAPSDDSKRSGKDPRIVWAERTAKLEPKNISMHYEKHVKRYKEPGQTFEACDENVEKNRYTDVLCSDSTRVVLKGRKNDYIHASYVEVPNGGTKYIAAQGPMIDTIEDFWAMIMQEKTKFIIMLCRLDEGGVPKCSKYYPDAKEKHCTYGDFTVSFVETKQAPCEDITWNVLSVESKSEHEPLEVFHVMVPKWPDQLAPVDAKPMLNIWRWVKRINPPGSTILVHCSAGVGRTSTFIGIDYTLAMIQENPETTIGDVIRDIRKQRYQAIQSHVQFLFLHVLIFEYLIEEGVIKKEGAVAEFIRKYESHAQRKIDKHKEKI